MRQEKNFHLGKNSAPRVNVSRRVWRLSARKHVHSSGMNSTKWSSRQESWAHRLVKTSSPPRRPPFFVDNTFAILPHIPPDRDTYPGAKVCKEGREAGKNLFLSS